MFFHSFLKEPFSNIAVGEEPPIKDCEMFDVVLNVSDTIREPFFNTNFIYHWYPVAEVQYWGYGVFFWAKRLLDKYYEEKKLILIHCHAGAHRSPMILMLWLTSKGYSIEEAISLFENRSTDKLFKLLHERDLEMGILPKNLPELFKRMEDNDWSLDTLLISPKPLEGTLQYEKEKEEKE